MFFAADTVIDPQTASPLTSLSAELRQMIFVEHFKVVNTHYGSAKLAKRPTLSGYQYRSTPSSVLALLETCRLFYQEAELCFYAHNSLEIVEMNRTLRHAYNLDLAHWQWQWWNGLTTTRQSVVRDMTVQIESTKHARSVFRFLRTLPNLRKVTLFVTREVATGLLGGDLANVMARRSGHLPEDALRSDFFTGLAMFKREMDIQFATAEPGRDEDDEHVRMLRDEVSAA